MGFIHAIDQHFFINQLLMLLTTRGETIIILSLLVLVVLSLIVYTSLIKVYASKP